MEKRRCVINGRNELTGAASHFCFNIDVSYNKRGNIEVDLPKHSLDFVPFFRSKKYVFNRKGECISHPPGKKYKYHNINAELVTINNG